MIAFIVIAAIFLLFFLLSQLSYRLVIDYREQFHIYLQILGFIKIPLIPGRAEKWKYSRYTDKAIAKRQKKEQKKAEKKDKTQDEKEERSSSSRTLTDNISLILELVKVFSERLFKHVRLKLSHINISLATSDAASTAILYGVVSPSVAYLLQYLDTLPTVKTPSPSEVSVYPDWTGEQTKVNIKIVISLRTWQFFDIIFRSFSRYLKIGRKTSTKPDTSETTGKHTAKRPEKTM